MSVPPLTRRLAPQTATAFVLARGARLEIIDPQGGQVADIAAFERSDVRERFSPGRTMDYNEKVWLSTGDYLYSNRSTRMLEIEQDDVGRHDILLAPCSARMFELLRGKKDHPSCHANLSSALKPFGIGPDDIEATFNAFMNVSLTAEGCVVLGAPSSKAGDCIVFRSLIDLVVGVSACSSEHTNAGTCKRIDFRILD